MQHVRPADTQSIEDYAAEFGPQGTPLNAHGVLSIMRHLLDEEKRWMRQLPMQDERNCILGAWMRSRGADEAENTRALLVVYHLVPSRLGSGAHRIAQWNDHAATHRDVLHLIDCALSITEVDGLSPWPALEGP